MCSFKAATYTDSSKLWALDVLSFSTEDWYDILTVNGIEYSGAQGPLSGLVPIGTIEWRADARQEIRLFPPLPTGTPSCPLSAP